MKLYSYVIRVDSGAAPNPFWGYCTLTICKPEIRRCARPGDWVTGIGSARSAHRGRLIYAMRVEEVIPLQNYFSDKRFTDKRPDPDHPDWRRRCGDNQYGIANESWFQLPGPHDPSGITHDVSGRHALVSRHYYYFGDNSIEVPNHLAAITQGGRGHRSWFPESMIRDFTRWLEGFFSTGIHGEPADCEVYRLTTDSTCQHKRPNEELNQRVTRRGCRKLKGNRVC